MNYKAIHIYEPELALQLYLRFSTLHYSQEQTKSITYPDLFVSYYLQTIVIKDKDQIFGLVSIFHNQELLFEEKQTLCFGYYECNQQEEIAASLIQEVERFAQAGNYSVILGPLNGSTWNNYRFSKQNIENCFLTERYHQAHYVQQLTALGFLEIGHYVSKIDRELNSLEASNQSCIFW
jgi:hypothetical protein